MGESGVINNSRQFGTVDLGTGAFSQIGPNTPEGTEGLVPGPNGSLLTLGFAGTGSNPLTGSATLVGATDLGIGAVVVVNGTPYAFNDVTGQVVSLDFTSGTSSFRGNFDPAAGVILGAAATVSRIRSPLPAWDLRQPSS